MTQTDLNAIALALAAYKDSFHTVTVEWPGCIYAQTEDALWVIGDVNGPIGADYYETIEAHVRGDSPNRSVELPTTTTTDATTIAAQLVAIMTAD